MKSTPGKILAVMIIGLGLLTLGLIIIPALPREPDLAQAICQPGDLGERYQRSNRSLALAHPQLDETVVDSYTVELLDLQLTYTVLQCGIVRYANEAAAQRAFEQLCAGQPEPTTVSVGEATCHFVGPAPQNLAFRRNSFLVLMSGDVRPLPAQAVDERLR